jgi:uncharacterized protein YbaA (DUF1428 family)
MSYFDGFVIPVPSGNKQDFIDHAARADSVFGEHGALRVIECWGDDVPDGKVTDFRKAVQATDGETVVFSWIEWPDKATRDAAMGKMEELMKTDDRFNPEKNPMPFDGKRLIYGGFAPIVDQGAGKPAAVQPYLFFRGRCEEAIEYYRQKLGAEVLMMMRFSDNPALHPQAKGSTGTLREHVQGVPEDSGADSGPPDSGAMEAQLIL